MHAPRPIPPAPFAKILPAIVAGILAADLWPVPTGAAVAVAALALAGMWLCRRNDTLSSLCTYAAIICCAAATTCATRPGTVLPRHQRLLLTLEITDAPVVSGSWQRATARIASFRPCTGDTTTWHRANEKVMVRLDTLHRIAAGDRLVATGYAGDPGSGAYAAYGRLMQRRGYSASLWIDSRQTLRTRASRLQQEATERLARLDLRPDAFATTAAMTTGDRHAIDTTLRDRYGVTGASHLLAVSGLHVGIVALLVNLLLWPLAAIWGYAALTGLSPSVVRAAAMFSGVQLALALSRPRSGVNLLCATASVMLLLWPNYLFDVSFQLSFAAVAGIFLLYPPLHAAVRSRFRAANAIWSVFIVGLAATLATLPLVSYHFGRIPLIGLVINPLLILTANITVLLALLWILAPVPALHGLFSTVLNTAAGFQNDLIATAARRSWASLPLRLSAAETLAAYLLLAAAGLAMLHYHRYRTSTRSTLPLPDKTLQP